MRLTEQQHKNLNRKYYHGSKSGKLTKTDSFYDYFFLSTSFVYAALFACSEDVDHGRVYEFNLKVGLDIFNARSRKDVNRLKTFIEENKIEVPKNWYKRGLEYEDWSFIFKNTSNRDSFVSIIEECGFDGFFNIEWTEKSTKGVSFGKEIRNKPAVGIFNIEKLEQKHIYEYKDYFNFKDFRLAFKEELNELKNFAVALNRNKIKTIQNNVFLYASDHCKLLDAEVVLDLLKNVDDLKIGEDFKPNVYQSGAFEECLQSGISRHFDRVGPYELNENYELVSHWTMKRFRKFQELSKSI